MGLANAKLNTPKHGIVDSLECLFLFVTPNPL